MCQRENEHYILGTFGGCFKSDLPQITIPLFKLELCHFWLFPIEMLCKLGKRKKQQYRKKPITTISCLSLQRIQLLAFWPDRSDSGDIWPSASYQALWSKKIPQTSCRICHTDSRIPACLSSFAIISISDSSVHALEVLFKCVFQEEGSMFTGLRFT